MIYRAALINEARFEEILKILKNKSLYQFVSTVVSKVAAILCGWLDETMLLDCNFFNKCRRVPFKMVCEGAILLSIMSSWINPMLELLLSLQNTSMEHEEIAIYHVQINWFVCYLMASTRYLNQCWLVIKCVLWHLPKSESKKTLFQVGTVKQ